MKTKSNTSWVAWLIALTNLSQLPLFVDSGTTQYITYLCWGLLAVCCIRPNSKIKINLFVLGLFVIPIFATLILSAVTTRGYINTRIFYSLILAFGILVLSHLIPDKMFKNDLSGLDQVYKAYIISSAIISISIYVSYFLGGVDLEIQYEYGSKNSTSQIIITAIILSLFCFKKNQRCWNIINLTTIAINLVVLFLMRSRASIIGLVIVVVMVLIDRDINKYVKWAMLAFSIAFICIVFLNNTVYDVIINKILFASRDSSSMNEISSGRFDQWVEFPQLFAKRPLLGLGRYKIEAFPLSVLVQYGMFLGGLIIVLSLYPLFYAFKGRRTNKHFRILLVVTLVYLLNGVFEELSPFGPGVKCYFIWFMMGILMREGNYARAN